MGTRTDKSSPKRLRWLARASIVLSLVTISACEPSERTAEEWLSRGIVQTQRGQLDKALESYEQAVELNPSDTTALVNRGLVKDELGDYEGAITDYSRAIELDPELTEAYYNRANTHHNQKQYALAIEDYSQAIAQSPEFAYGYVNRAINHELLGDVEQAISDLDQAIVLFKASGAEADVERVSQKRSELLKSEPTTD